MTNTIKKLSLEDIKNIELSGKGINCKVQVPICLAAIAANADCGACQWLLEQCGYKPTKPVTPPGNCVGCTCP